MPRQAAMTHAQPGQQNLREQGKREKVQEIRVGTFTGSLSKRHGNDNQRGSKSRKHQSKIALRSHAVSRLEADKIYIYICALGISA